MKQIISLPFFIFFILFYATTTFAQNKTFSKYKVLEFEFQGHDAKIVFPQKVNEQKYWIWRARFWGH
ncbi:MAG: hypothetical protein L3J54_12390, partial [Draconibacterium sp.]|nr:hypothetical protein [Draconibacterium sp.]